MPGDRTDSVFTAEWYPLDRMAEQENLSEEDWTSILLVKEAVNKVIEEQRNQGIIKGSLSA